MAEANYSAIEKFFLFCSGADLDVLSKCPQKEKNKTYGVGSLVFMTAVFAFLSSGYAMYRVVLINSSGDIDTGWLPIVISIIFGIIWAFFIFFLDRYLVSTISKTESILNQLINASPRIVLAIVISLTISRPFEVWIFKNRIESQILSNKKDFKSSILKDEIGLNKTLQNNSLMADSNITALNTAVGKDTKEIEDLKADYDKCITEYKEVDNLRQPERDVLKTQISILNRKLTALRSQSAIDETEVNNVRTEMDQKVKRQTDIGTELRKINSGCAEIQNRISKLRKENVDRLTNQIVVDKNLKESYQSQLTVADKDLNQKGGVVDAAGKKAFSENLITQMEALNDLLNARGVDPNDKQELHSREILNYQNWVIIFLFLLIEVAPIFAKLLAPLGEYDQLIHINLIGFKQGSDSFNIYRNQVADKVYLELKSSDLDTISHFSEKLKGVFGKVVDDFLRNWDEKKGDINDLINNLNKILYTTQVSNLKKVVVEEKEKKVVNPINPPPVKDPEVHAPERETFAVKTFREIKTTGPKWVADKILYIAGFAASGMGLFIAHHLFPEVFTK